MTSQIRIMLAKQFKSGLHLFFASCLLYAFGISSQVWAETAKINDLRLADRDTTTRLVFDLSSNVTHNVFILKNPDRVVLDIDNCIANGNLETKRVGGTLLKGMRYAQKDDEKLRVVFDMNTTVAPKSFLLKPANGSNYRLVLDLTKSSTTQTTTPVMVAPAAPKTYRDVIVAIDPGHGGKDPGALGRGGTREKHIVLSISKQLKTMIDAQKGMRAVLIREKDTFITLRGRIKKAKQNNADIFISIHADAAVDRRAKGSSVYVLSQTGASSEAAKILAQRENEVDKIGGVDLDGKDPVLKSVLLDLQQNATIDESLELAEDILGELAKVGKLLRRRVEHAGFAVLKSPDIPSVLVETAFISNPQDEKRLKNPAHQKKLAQAILYGVKKYFKDHAPSDAILAHLKEPSTHTIKNGETLSGIAQYYQVSLGALRKVNSLKTDVIRVGQVLRIPPATGT